MRNHFSPGEKIKGPCQQCRSFVSATFGHGTVQLEDGTPVEGILRATCDTCGSIVATAPQSAHLFREAIEAKGIETVTRWLTPSPPESRHRKTPPLETP